MKDFCKLIILLSSISIMLNCGKKEPYNFEELCPYDALFFVHYLEVPITISPNKIQYNIGDTINISTIFSDSIYDIGMQHTFKIENFPFIPVPLLYRYDENLNKSSGFRENELIVDEKYNHVYNYSSEYADGFRAYTIYDPENEIYHFEFDIILQQTGSYVMIMSDLYNSYAGSGNADKNAEADAITFEGQCVDAPFSISSNIKGDDHILSFAQELIHLDTSVYRGRFESVHSTPEYRVFGNGSLVWEWNGTFCFEVVE